MILVFRFLHCTKQKCGEKGKHISKDPKAKKFAILKIHNGGSGMRVRQRCHQGISKQI